MSPAGIMVEGGNWGEVMNGYFEKAGLDPTDPTSPVKLAKIQFGGDATWMDRYGMIDEYATAIAFLEFLKPRAGETLARDAARAADAAAAVDDEDPSA